MLLHCHCEPEGRGNLRDCFVGRYDLLAMTCEVALRESLLMRILVTLILFTFLFFLFPAAIFSEVIVQDMIAPKGKEIMLSVEIRGKLFIKGGEVVEIFVDGRPLGRSLSGGDGFAFKQFTPLKTGRWYLHRRYCKLPNR